MKSLNKDKRFDYSALLVDIKMSSFVSWGCMRRMIYSDAIICITYMPPGTSIFDKEVIIK